MTDLLFNRVVRRQKILTASISLRDLEGLAKLIRDKNAEAVAIEHIEIGKLNVSDEEKEKYRELVADLQKMTIFINGADGDNLVAYNPDIFQSHLLPTIITSITIETQTSRQVQTKADPPNYVRLHFDFSKIRFGSPQFTPAGTVMNISSLEVQGSNESWVTSTFKALSDRLSALRNARTILHSPGSYEVGLYLIALPAYVFLLDQVYRNNQTSFDSLGVILRIGLLIYAFFLGVIAYRQLYNYALWTFPSIDIVNERDTSSRHRKFWFSLTTSLIVGAISYYLYKR